MVVFVYGAIFFTILLAVNVLFVVSLCRYISAKKQNKANTETFADEEIRDRKIKLIETSVVAFVLNAIVIGVAVLLYSAIAYM